MRTKTVEEILATPGEDPCIMDLYKIIAEACELLTVVSRPLDLDVENFFERHDWLVKK